MKIVHIIFSFNTGGSETMLVDIVNEQVKTRQVYLIIINNSINQALIEKVSNEVNINLIGRKEGSRGLFSILKLNVLLFKISPNVIHCHQQSIIQLLFKPKNVMLTVHATGITTKNLNKYQKVFAISKAVKNDIESRSNIKGKVVYNGIKTEDVKVKFDDDFKIFKLVQVSSLVSLKKGQYLLIEALNVLVNKKGIRNIKLDFIGEGPSLNSLKELVKQYKLNHIIRFLGRKDRIYIYGHLKDYELLVQPSLYEGFGLTIVEAMAAKLPVLVSNIEGPMEVIAKGQFGSFFESENTIELSEKIMNIMNDYKNSIELAEQAFIYVNKEFNVSKTANSYILNYRN